jgi:hypothetical protein
MLCSHFASRLIIIIKNIKERFAAMDVKLAFNKNEQKVLW